MLDTSKMTSPRSLTDADAGGSLVEVALVRIVSFLPASVSACSLFCTSSLTSDRISTVPVSQPRRGAGSSASTALNRTEILARPKPMPSCSEKRRETCDESLSRSLSGKLGGQGGRDGIGRT